MPTTATITAFYNFTALTTIRSSEVNNNFDSIRGHIIPIDPSTSTSAATRTYDLGSYDHSWRSVHNQYGMMYANTAGSVPTVSTSTAYALYFKNDGNLYKKDSSGTETAFSAAGNLNVASTTGGFNLTNSNDIVLANISASSSTYNLFTAVGNSGKILRIKKIDLTTTVATIDPNSSETIDGYSTFTLNSPNDEVTIVSDGSNWQKVSVIKSPTIQKFTSGSGTYTTPNGCKFIKVKMVGGGGGGGGSGNTGIGTGGTGGNTTFGTTLLVANGGTGGSGSTITGTGGTASLGTGPIGTAIQGGSGSGINTSGPGGSGAASPFGGAGGGGITSATNTGTGSSAIANTGSGGGGAGSTLNSGSGGGAGGFVEAIITSPSATYSYAVGAAGTGGTAGTGTPAAAGGAGGSGYIEVVEYY